MVFGQQCDVVIMPLTCLSGIAIFATTARGNIALAPQDRLDAAGEALLIELDRPEHIPVVGQGQGRHLKFLGLLYHLLQRNGAVQEAIVTVIMKMDKVGVEHGVTPLVS